MKQQRYVSDELTHFVGAKLPSNRDRFALLLAVLREGVLKIPGSSDVVVGIGPSGGQQISITRSHTLDHSKRLSSNDKYRASIVCFADIPLEDLPFHARKYGPFGLSFRKSFLVGKGASPVFYVAKQSATDWRNPLANDPTNFSIVQAMANAARNRGGWWNLTRAELYDEADRTLSMTELTRQATGTGRGLEDEAGAEGLGIVTIRRFLAHELFPFLKFFDADLAEDDPNNFYMEREWRVIGPVRFELAEVERILLPRAFAAELKKQMPEFHGQLTFIEPHCDAYSASRPSLWK